VGIGGGDTVNRDDFQRLANERIADAKALLAARRWGAAYYLAGYAVECGLKSCILVRLTGKVELIFEEKRYSEKCWTHDLGQLMELAALEAAFAADSAADPELSENWEIVKDWSEASRYEVGLKAVAVQLYEAITDKKHGVLTWIRTRW
jgi:HEPN domain-containing protein